MSSADLSSPNAPGPVIAGIRERCSPGRLYRVCPKDGLTLEEIGAELAKLPNNRYQNALTGRSSLVVGHGGSTNASPNLNVSARG
jgi:hypothetical protein